MREDRTTKILASLALLHDDLDAIRSELANIRSDLDKIAAAHGSAAPALVRPRPPEPPVRPPIEERIRQLRQRGFSGYDAARILMREHYPMREIVRHLRVSPRKLAGLGEGEEEK